MAERGTDITGFKRTYSTRNEGSYPETFTLGYRKESDQKYGENPNQQAAIYALETILTQDPRTIAEQAALYALNHQFNLDILEAARKSAQYALDHANLQNTGIIAELTNIRSVRSDSLGKGGLSANNMMDVTRAMDTLKYFRETRAAAIMKHTIVAGFAKQVQQNQTLCDLFRLARDADRQSNMGGTFVSTVPLDRNTAEAMYELKGDSAFFVDVVAAPGYDDGVIGFIEKQAKNIRIVEFSNLEVLPRFQGHSTLGLKNYKDIGTGRTVAQDLYLPSIKGVDDLILDPMIIDKDGNRHVIQRDPTSSEIDDLLTAWYLNVGSVKSNGIVGVRRGVSTGIGSGQVERFGAVAYKLIKGYQKAMDREGIKYNVLMGIQGHENLKDDPFKGSCVSSDAFFPFADSVHLLGSVGVKAIIQPYGSIRDAEVIDAANQYGMAMPATLERCFLH